MGHTAVVFIVILGHLLLELPQIFRMIMSFECQSVFSLGLFFGSYNMVSFSVNVRYLPNIFFNKSLSNTEISGS